MLDLLGLAYGTVTITAQGGKFSFIQVNTSAKPDQLDVILPEAAA